MESEFLEWLRDQLQRNPSLRREPLPPGRDTSGLDDDAAVLDLPTQRPLVLTSDLLTDGVDFLLDDVDPRRVGHKALAVNLSDIAAMAAQPVAAIISVALPELHAGVLARQLYQGIFPLATRYGVAIAGGDTNTWPGRLVMSITILGQAGERGPLRRCGARPGDHILVTGTFGGSILGHHLDFEPRLQEAVLLHQNYRLHAGIDVSDGLSLDVARMARESGCGAVLSLDTIPVSQAAHELARRPGDQSTALEHALADGEDFELILAVPGSEADRMLADQPLSVPLTRIGHFVKQSGLWQLDTAQARQPLHPRGFEH